MLGAVVVRSVERRSLSNYGDPMNLLRTRVAAALLVTACGPSVGTGNEDGDGSGSGTSQGETSATDGNSGAMSADGPAPTTTVATVSSTSADEGSSTTDTPEATACELDFASGCKLYCEGCGNGSADCIPSCTDVGSTEPACLQANC